MAERKRQIIFTHMWNIEKNQQTKQKQTYRYREQISDYQKERRIRLGEMG